MTANVYLFGSCDASLWSLAENFNGILAGALIRVNPVFTYNIEMW